MDEEYDLEGLKHKIVRLEAQVSVLKDIIKERPSPVVPEMVVGNEIEASEAFGTMTLKQNAALQLVLKGYSNSQMAEVFDCSPSTCKVHVRGVMDKVNAHTRAKVILAVKRMFDAVDEGVYLGVAGLAKDWSDDPDVYPKITELIRAKTR